MEETPFNYVMSLDVAYFVHQRELCNLPDGNTYLERHKQ